MTRVNLALDASNVFALKATISLACTTIDQLHAWVGFAAVGQLWLQFIAGECQDYLFKYLIPLFTD